MSSIITVTLNPAIDKSSTVLCLEPAKKLRCSPPAFQPGGGGVNVARVIHKLGGRATAIYFAGGHTGEFYKQLLDKERIVSAVIRTKKQLRENFIVVDESSGLQYRFTMPGPHIYEAEWKKMLKKIEQYDSADFIVVSGSVAPGVPGDIIAKIAKIAKRQNIKLIVDCSGRALKSVLDKTVYLMKLNVEELSELAGKNLTTIGETVNAAKEMIRNSSIKVLVISLGEKGALLVTADTAKHFPAPKVKVKSTVGAGDSMLAGIVFSLSRGKTIDESVNFGVICGTAATVRPGTLLCDLKTVKFLLAKYQD
jgi:6-phosphofructokinase 2